MNKNKKADLKSVVLAGWRLLHRASKAFIKKDCFDLAASISFYSVLSAIPFLFLAVYIFSVVLGSSDEFVHDVNMLLMQIRPHLAGLFLEEISKIAKHSNSLGWFGFGFLLWTATLVFHSVERAFDEIFENHKRRPFVHSIFCSLIMIPLMGALLFSAVAIITILKAMSHFQLEIGGASSLSHLIVEVGIGRVVPVLLIIVSFTIIYKFVPSTTLSFRQALIGGVMATILWETALRIFISFALTTRTYSTIFGSFKTVIIILLSFYYSSCVLLFCGEIIAQYRPEKR